MKIFLSKNGIKSKLNKHKVELLGGQKSGGRSKTKKEHLHFTGSKSWKNLNIARHSSMVMIMTIVIRKMITIMIMMIMMMMMDLRKGRCLLSSSILPKERRPRALLLFPTFIRIDHCHWHCHCHCHCHQYHPHIHHHCR